MPLIIYNLSEFVFYTMYYFIMKVCSFSMILHTMKIIQVRRTMLQDEDVSLLFTLVINMYILRNFF